MTPTLLLPLAMVVLVVVAIIYSPELVRLYIRVKSSFTKSIKEASELLEKDANEEK